MDFGADDELDYEEDGLESDSLKNNSESMNCLGNGVNMNTNFPSFEEDYLQINCSEEEENFVGREEPSETVISEEAKNLVSDERPSENVNSEVTTENVVEAHKVQKGNGKDEESGKAKKQKIFIRKEVRTKSNHLNDFKCNNGNARKKKVKKKEHAWPFPRRPPVKKKLTHSLTLNSWLPEYDFSEAGDTVKPGVVPYNNNQLLRLHRNCPASEKPTVPMPTFDAFQRTQNLQQGNLLADDKRFVSSNSPIGVNARNLTQQWFKPLMSESLTPFNEDISEFKTGDHNMNFSKNLGFNNNNNNNMENNASSKNEKFKNASLHQKNIDIILRQNQQHFAQNCRAGEPKGDCRNTLKGSHFRIAGCIPLHKCDWKYEAETTVSFLSEPEKCAMEINALKDDEKELVKLKKEARRKRFMQDAIIKKEKETFESNVAKKPDNCLPMMGKAKLLEEKFQRRENQDCKNDHNSLLEKGNLKKELLLKKRNPFDGSIEKTNCIAGTKIKQEALWNENFKMKIEEEMKILKEAKVEKQPMENDESKVLGGLYSNGPGLFVVKKETGPQVKFVRTISKSFDELGFGKSKAGVISVRNEDCTFALKALPFVNEGVQEQVTRQLTGCIVKVLNIPPSTTTNDILALCSSIGIVREVKLNFPKENSAVIRFAEPSSADNFFSLYHGQKMNNYFLNVIII